MKRLWLMLLLAALSPFALAADKAETLMVNGQKRQFLVHDFSDGKPTALVILLHGGGGNGSNMAEQTGFDAVARREQLIAVYPFGDGVLPNSLLTWNAGHCCAYSIRNKIDDMAFLAQLIDHLIKTRKVDSDRVYITGLSNGGMMSHTAGIALHDKLAAIAPVISSLWGDEPDSTFTLPVLIINGADDERVKVNGGELQGFGFARKPADKPTLPISSQREYWAKVNGCHDYTDSETDDYTLRRYTDCQHHGDVQAYVVKHNGHAWPGGTKPRGLADEPAKNFNANEVIWDFFKQHTRQRSR